MAHILIATLGESPIVVTSLVNLLQHGVPEQDLAPIELDQVILLYPQGHEQIQYGIELIQQYCRCSCITLEALSFKCQEETQYEPDIRNEDDCYTFLRHLQRVLERTQKAQDKVYLSLAGGRKSMSALMGLLSSFYNHIQGVFHILDRYEDDPNNKRFYPLEKLIFHNIDHADEMQNIMNPPAEDLNVIQLPFHSIADAADLRAWMEHDDPEENIPIHLDWIPEESRGFWKGLFNTQIESFYRIRLSPSAHKQIAGNVHKFSRYFTLSKLRNSQWANKRCKEGSCGSHLTWKGTDKTPFNIAKSGGAERILWYQHEQTVVCTELAIEDKNGDYIQVGGSTKINKAFCVKKTAADYPPEFLAPTASSSDDAILIAPLGKSPMVVTQAYTLFSREKVNISRVAVIYPEENGDVIDGFDLLQEVFEEKDVLVLEYPVALSDVASTQDCTTFLQELVNTITDLRTQFPEADLRMLLSGGRKGMSALALLAAQQSHISHVYHTLITDQALEDRIEHECSTDQINRMPGTAQKAERLFLDAYPQDKFVLFGIPVIPLQAPAS